MKDSFGEVVVMFIQALVFLIILAIFIAITRL